MASDDLWTASGTQQHSGCSRSMKKKRLFAKNIVGTTRNWRPAWGDRPSARKLKCQKSLGSQQSDESSRARRPPMMAVFPTHLESAHGPKLPLEATTMSPSSSLTDRNQNHSPGGEEGEDEQGSSGMISVSTAEDSPPSPRAQLKSHTTEAHQHPSTVNLGPLERYLDQDDGSSYFEDGQGEEPVGEEWTRLRSLRAKVLRLRAYVRTKRKEIHAQQQIKENADEAFMKYVRERRAAASMHLSAFPGASTDEEFDARYEAMQAARDNCGPLEYEFRMSEDHLDEAEFELAQLEGRLYKARPHEGGSRPEPSIQPAPAESLLGLQQNMTPRYHPSHHKYLSRLGDLDLAMERYQNLLQESDKFLSMQESRVLVGTDLSQQNMTFLENFQEQTATLQAEISYIQQEVERLREMCLAEGINLEEGSSYYGSEGSPEGLQSEVDGDIIIGGNSITEPSTFSLLLPASVEGKRKLRVLITDFDEGNKSDRINRWIRHQLRLSFHEVKLLLKIFQQVMGTFGFRGWQVDVFLWQLDVLFYWVRDEGNKSPETFRASQSRSFVTTIHTTSTVRQRTPPKILDVQRSPSIPFFKHQRVRSAPPSFDLGLILKKPPREGSFSAPHILV